MEDQAESSSPQRRGPRLWVILALVPAAAVAVFMGTVLVLHLTAPSIPLSTASPSPTPSSIIAVVTPRPSIPATESPSVAPSTSPSSSASPSPSGPTPAPTARWHPAVGDTFQIQYAGPIDITVAASVYDLDSDDTPASTVAALHSVSRHVFCYIDAGAWESYRSDAGSFPKSVLGKVIEGWPNERWLDIRKIDTLAPILRHRLDTCAAKGFDGVDPDNINGYTNSTGFPLTAADQLRFNRWLAAEAHARGLAIALKNDGEQARDLVSVFDAAVVEECVAFDECGLYSPFVAAGKPVFDIEYDRPPNVFCPIAQSLHFEIIGKDLELNVYRSGCDD